MPTLFTQIINQEIPSYKVYEDEMTYAFLDIFPIQKWQVVIVPKVEVDHFYDLDDTYYWALMQTAKMLAPKLKKALWAKRCWVIIEWLEVPHAHIKLVPITTWGDLDSTNVYEASKEELEEISKLLIVI